ncbi:ribonuclease HII [Nereida ignava]|uniref:Ribonuclease HII n=1 Tax=Nereida ignava TaxID=282199 RepID=A0A0U1NKN8_9RHOB|nr:ribonuclease HII [Nereida ignava]CRK75277.1 Ribonuclease HII [Nereida ignava]SFJ71498.1 RNase HII [Nereida ignava DSM 16309]
MKTFPTFDLESELYTSGRARIIGVDEVGRGPLAGPVVAAAVWLDPGNIPDGLNDSKKVPLKLRNALAELLPQIADVSIGEASVQEIDELNILRASHLAMERAVAGLDVSADFALVDGNLIPRDLAVPARAVVKGDAISQSIAAASIVAKVRRDQLMLSLAQQYPGYGWEKNQGYPTKAHREALQNLGVTPHHRRSFKPVHNML